MINRQVNVEDFLLDLFKIQSWKQKNNIVSWIYTVYQCDLYDNFSAKDREGGKSACFIAWFSYFMHMI